MAARPVWDWGIRYYLCSTYRRLWELVVVRLLWLSGRALVAQAIGVLGSIPGDCRPFHFPLFSPHNIQVHLWTVSIMTGLFASFHFPTYFVHTSLPKCMHFVIFKREGVRVMKTLAIFCLVMFNIHTVYDHTQNYNYNAWCCYNMILNPLISCSESSMNSLPVLSQLLWTVPSSSLPKYNLSQCVIVTRHAVPPGIVIHGLCSQVCY